MSVLKPSILINPQYATNTLDTQQAGWYQVIPNSSNLALRVNYSNIGLKGEIRLNTTTLPPVFQGNNGSAWVDFNAVIGPTGPAGQDFNNAVNFNNLGANTSAGLEVPLANIFATTYVNVGMAISNVNIRSLQGGEYTINSNLTVDSMILTQNSNVITLEPQPLPYNWDFASGSAGAGVNSTLNTVSNLKNASSDLKFYSWGKTSNWIVQQGQTIVKGQAVRLTRDSVSSSNIVITPITYTNLSLLNPFVTPFNMLGIATQTASGGNSCVICTKGITTVLCTSNITADFVITSDISSDSVGLFGLVGKDAGIFCPTQVNIGDYIIAGYFLESGTGIANNGNYALFYVDPQVHIS
jgi:hypothetical protein